MSSPPSGLIAATRARVVAITEQVDAVRRRVVPFDLAWRTYERDRAKHGNLLAGAVAFRLFIFMLPLYLLVLVALGVAFAFDPASPERLANSSGMSSQIARNIASASETTHESLWLLVPVTLYALASAGYGAYKAIATSHASAWDQPTPKMRKPWIAVPIFVLFTAFAIGFGPSINGFREGYLAPLAIVVSLLYFFAFWMAASHLLPRGAGTTWRTLLPGAVAVAVGSQGLYWFNVLYLNHKVQSASEAYGALGIAATTLLWLYLIGRLLVAAPMLNATVEAWRNGTGSEGISDSLILGGDANPAPSARMSSPGSPRR